MPVLGTFFTDKRYSRLSKPRQNDIFFSVYDGNHSSQDGTGFHSDGGVHGLARIPWLTAFLPPSRIPEHRSVPMFCFAGQAVQVTVVIELSASHDYEGGGTTYKTLCLGETWDWVGAYAPLFPSRLIPLINAILPTCTSG